MREHDEDWWDGEHGERIAELQRVLAPLRESPRPWGEVIARARIFAEPRSRSTMWYAAMAGGLAAALAIGWMWGRNAQPSVEPETIERAVLPVPVAEPPTTIELPTTTEVVPMRVPTPIVVEPPAPAEAPKLEAPHATGEVPAPVERAAPRPSRRSTPRAPRESTTADTPVRTVDPGTDVDCILDPRLDKCTGDRTAPDDLPDTLTTTEVKQGISPTKDGAKRCGEKHGADPGERVLIKLTIQGATGTVYTADPEPPHAGTELGRCVAEAVAKAQFPRFRKDRLGVIYPFTM